MKNPFISSMATYLSVAAAFEQAALMNSETPSFIRRYVAYLPITPTNYWAIT